MTCMVHHRKQNKNIPLNQDGRSVHIVARKLDLDYRSHLMIVIIFVTQNNF